MQPAPPILDAVQAPPAVAPRAAAPSTSDLPGLRWLSRRSEFAGNVASLSLGTAAAQVFSILAAPVITRLYVPATLGQLGLFVSFLSVALVAASLKYEVGIVSANDEAEAAQLTWASLLFALPVSILSGGVLWLMSRHAWFGFGGLPGYAAWLLVPTMFFAAAWTALRYWYLRRESFGFVSKTYIVQHAARAIYQTGAGFVLGSSFNLFAGELIGRCFGMVRAIRCAWPALKKDAISVPLRTLREPLRRHRKFPIYSLPSTMIDTFAANMSLPFIVALFGTTAAGHYALVQRVLSVPMGLVATSVADAFHSRFAIYARGDRAHMSTFFRRTSLALFLLGLGPACVLGFFARPLFAFVFGHEWATAGTLAAICAPWFLAQFVVSPVSRLVFVLRGQESKLAYDIVLLISTLALFWIASVRGLDLFTTVRALMLVNAFAYGVYFLVLLRIITRHEDTDVTQPRQ